MKSLFIKQKREKLIKEKEIKKLTYKKYRNINVLLDMKYLLCRIEYLERIIEYESKTDMLVD